MSRPILIGVRWSKPQPLDRLKELLNPSHVHTPHTQHHSQRMATTVLWLPVQVLKHKRIHNNRRNHTNITATTGASSASLDPNTVTTVGTSKLRNLRSKSFIPHSMCSHKIVFDMSCLVMTTKTVLQRQKSSSVL